MPNLNSRTASVNFVITSIAGTPAFIKNFPGMVGQIELTLTGLTMPLDACAMAGCVEDPMILSGELVPTNIPEPMSFALLATALVALGQFGRREAA